MTAATADLAAELDTVVTVLPADECIQAICTDWHKLKCAHSVSQITHTKMEIKKYELTDKKTLQWNENGSLDVLHGLHVGRLPHYEPSVLAILDKTLLVYEDLGMEKIQLRLIFSCNGATKKVSQIIPCSYVPHFACCRSEILVPTESTVQRLQLKSLNPEPSWEHEAIVKPRMMTSNKERLAVYDEETWMIKVFHWIKEFPEAIAFQVNCENCSSFKLLQDNTMMAITVDCQWSVWSGSGKVLHKDVQHPTLINGLQINSSNILQDPVSRKCYVQEFGELSNGTVCQAIYGIRVVLNRMNDNDFSMYKIPPMKRTFSFDELYCTFVK